MSYLLQPTKRYGKSKILFYHNCRSSNRVDRLLGKYNKDDLANRLLITIQSYIRKYDKLELLQSNLIRKQS